MRKLSIFLIAFAIAVAIAIIPSCTKDYVVPEDVVIPDTVSFSQNVIPIFEDDCNKSGCHVSGGVAPNLTPSSAYSDLWLYGLIDTVDDRASILYERISSTSEPMPPTGNMPVGEQELILKWIEQGALDN